MFFVWPIHVVDYDGRLEDCDFLTGENNKRTKIELMEQNNELEELISQCPEYISDDGVPCFAIRDLLDKYREKHNKPPARTTINKYVREAGYDKVKVDKKQGYWSKY